MKKLNVVLLSTLLILAACGDENVDGGSEQESASPDTEPVEISEESEATTEEEDSSEIGSEEVEENTSDQQEDLSYDDAAELLEGTAHPIQFFMAEDESLTNEEGMTVIDFKGFILGMSVFLVDFKPSEEYLYDYDDRESIRALLVLTEAENTNDFDVNYNGDMTFTTDTKEQVRGDAGIFSSNDAVMTYYGQVEAVGYYIIPLKDDSEPKQLTAILEGPWKLEDGAINVGNGPMGGEIRVPLVAVE